MVFFLFVPLLCLYNYGKNGMIFFCLFRCYPYNLQLQERSDLKPAIVELAKLELLINRFSQFSFQMYGVLCKSANYGPNILH